MDNKKLQELIAKLQEKSEMPMAEQTGNEVMENPEAVQTYSAGSNSNIVSYPNEYFTIEEYNGDPFDQGQRIGLGKGDTFKVTVDYDKVLEDFGPNVVLRFMGITKMYHLFYSIYSANGRKLIGNYKCIYDGGSFYDVQLDEVYRKTGSASFTFKANWEGTEALALNMCRMYSGVSQNTCLGIEIETSPYTTDYKEGDFFNPNGMVVKGVFADNTTEIITDYTYSPNRALTTSDTSITIQCNGFSCSQPITVGVMDSIYVATAPTKTKYIEGEVFDKTGMKVYARYTNGVTVEITGYTFAPTRALTTADTSVTISYKGFSCTQSITVGALNSIYIATLPTKMTYLLNNFFDPTGMVVKAVYTNEVEKVITDYTLSNTDLTYKYKTVTISYQGKTTTLTVDVSGQEIELFGTELQKSTDYGKTWTKYSNGSSISCIHANDIRYRTIVKIPKSSIDFNDMDSAHIKMLLTAEQSTRNPVDFYVNEKLYRKQSIYNNIIIDLGVVQASGQDDVELIFSCKNLSDSISFYNSGTNAPVIYISRVTPEGMQNPVKGFSLTGGANFGIEVTNGRLNYAINYIAPDKSLLGYGISHVYAGDSTVSCYGMNFRLNLQEKLVRTALNNGLFSYTYTDAAGNATDYKTILYCMNGDTKYFLTDADMKNLQKDNGNLTFNGETVYTEVEKIGNQVLLTEPTDVIKDCAYYKSLRESEKTQFLWLSGGGLVKGFNRYGNLAIVIDDFGKYFTLSYGNYDNITYITDCNGKTIQFTYDNYKLTSITDSRGRVYQFGYFENEFVNTANDSLQLVSITTPDHTLSFNYTHIGILSSVASSDGYKYEFEYNNKAPCYGGVKSVTKYSTLDKVPDGEDLKTEISRLDFDYTDARTSIKDSDGNELLYFFNIDGANTFYYEITDGIVTYAERYYYRAFEKYIKIKADKSTLYKTSFSNYTFVDGEKATYYFDSSNNVTSAEIKNIPLTGNYNKNSKTEYTYKDGRVKAIKTTDEYQNETIVTQTQIDNGGNANNGITTTTCVTKDGVNEYSGVFYQYNDNGDLIRKAEYPIQYMSELPFHFNTFISYDENHRVTEEKDESYSHKVNYEYKPDTDLVNKITLANGGEYFYTYDSRDRVTKMRSTVGGVENANNTLYYNDEVIGLSHSGNGSFVYEYDEKRRISKVYLNGDLYESYTYEDNVLDGSKKVDKVTRTNANGENFTAVSDKLGNYYKLYYNGRCIYTYSYSPVTREAVETDSLNSGSSTTNHYYYDSCGNLTHTWLSVGNNDRHEYYTYDDRGRIINDDSHLYTYGGLVDEYVSKAENGPFTVKNNLNEYRLYAGKTVKCSGKQILDESILYLQNQQNMPKLPWRVTQNEEKTEYTYDGCGNIRTATIIRGLLVTTYTYDKLNRLVREDNQSLEQSYAFTYDNNGNITSKKIDAFHTDGNVTGTVSNKTYSYVNGKLTSFGGETCAYDNVGNPTTYRGKAATWQYGRRLTKLGSNTFKYDALGKRIQKNGIKFTYDGRGRLIKQSNGLEFYYDDKGVMGFKYDGENYLYRKDIQGNIIGIINSDGIQLVRYTYDAWGNHTVAGNSTLRGINPFRYRGYYYDTETGLYYLQTRYYDPEVGRFINMDSLDYADPDSINGLNLYAYCNNNPVMYVDPDGHIPKWLQGLAIGLAVIGVILVVGAITALTMGVGTTIMATTMAGAVIHGAAVGTLIGAGVGVVAGGIIGGATTNWSSEGILVGMGIGFGGGAIIGAIVGGSVGALQYTNAVSQWGSAGGRTAQQNMIKHFEKHVINEGHSYLGKNVVKYTKNAVKFFKSNSSLMKLTSSGNYVIRATFAGHSVGGFFNLAGIVFSFF